ncbi:hypothetical protein [Methyloversatilis thermotolerans]|uniref:hypothetical protein n=1 Tax=Methyloversatilis thermotolerans TaxID=1346290 RepID=UPI0006866EEE|nr:hypothetical protein [Methyloversatilis thermotolerans]
MPTASPDSTPVAPKALGGAALQSVLDWLNTPATDDAGAHAHGLASHLALLDTAVLDPAARARVLDIFHDRALACAQMLKPDLAASGLPVGEQTYRAGLSLAGVLMRLAAGYLDALQLKAVHRPHRAAGHAMQCLLESYTLCVLIAADAVPGTWRTALTLLVHQRAMATPLAQSAGRADAEQMFRQLLALTLAQPPHLSPPEFFNIGDYVRAYSGAVQIQHAPPHRDLDSWFWLDDGHDEGPIPLLREKPDPERAGHILYCSCQRLGQMLGHHLDQIDAGGTAADLHLPACLGQPRTRRLMRGLQARWMATPRRQHARRERQGALRMLIGLDAIWTVLDRRDAAMDWEQHTTGWTLLNDSPNGLALRMDSGPTELLRPGVPVLIKNAGSRTWMICVVRWARSNRHGEVDAGVELLSHGAQAATVVFNQGGRRDVVRALRLPPLASLRPHPALMLPTGCVGSTDLMIAHVAGERFRLGEARLSMLDLQTPVFDLYEISENGSGGRGLPAS